MTTTPSAMGSYSSGKLSRNILFDDKANQNSSFNHAVMIYNILIYMLFLLEIFFKFPAIQTGQQTLVLYPQLMPLL